MRAVIGLGSNVGDRRSNLRAAVEALREVATVLAESSVVETKPVGGPPQPDYLNAAALVSFEGSPRALLQSLLAIEARLGRVRAERWGPRTIDLDLLWIDGVVVSEPDLVVPHPRLTERAFALQPLLEVAPDAIDPRTGAPLRARS
jgi:2-amino-4-hydroxy-6-hydroxymethyldihydropteridine diphosphokinase